MYTTCLPHKVELCVVVVHKAANPIQLDDSMILLLLENTEEYQTNLPAMGTIV